MDDSVIHYLFSIFQEEKLSCSLVKPSEGSTTQELLLSIDPDRKSRPRAVQIKVNEQILHAPSDNSTPKTVSYYHIQFISKLPFPLVQGAIRETEALVLFINRTLELPGFEISELDDALFYRYVWMIGENGLDRNLILGITGIIVMTLDLLSDLLEKIASGSITFNQALEKALNVSK